MTVRNKMGGAAAAAALVLSLSFSSQGQTITSLTVLVNGSAHVTVEDQNSNPLGPTTISWSSNGPDQLGTVTADTTGFVFACTVAGAATAIATYTPSNVSASLPVTCQASNPAQPVTSLQFTSP